MASPDKLVMMANQIGSFFVTQPGETAVADTATHIRKFWDPRMRTAILAHLDAGGAGLNPLVRQAIERLKVMP
jgi:formate dehydrogenase subunit delta